ncbi:hypothetical protein AB3S75_012625 [Citrus x aurantiifolia]
MLLLCLRRVKATRLRRSNLFNSELEEEDEEAVDSWFTVVVVIPTGAPVTLALLQQAQELSIDSPDGDIARTYR